MKNRKRKNNSIPQRLNILADGVVDLAAADENAEGKKLRTFSILAYTGGAMTVSGFPYPVIVDLAGCRASRGQLPVLRDHDLSRVIGHATEVKSEAGQIRLEGAVSGVGSDAAEVVTTADNGFQWKASIGAKVVRAVFVAEGKEVSVNGQTFSGPVYVARKSVLREVSIVAIGADERAETRIAASDVDNSQSTTMEIITMKFEQWLKAQGWDNFEDLAENQQKTLRAAYDAEQRAAVDDQDDEPDNDNEQPDVQAQVGQALTRERQRVNDIEAMCDGDWGTAAETVTELRAQAMTGTIDNDTLARKLLNIRRESRPGVPAIQSKDRRTTSQVIEAAACMTAMIPEDIIIKAYGEEVISRADEQYRGIGLRGVIHLAAMAEGVMLPEFTTNQTDWVRAAFSTMSLPGILSSIANKKLEEGFNYGDQSWRDICKIGSVSDFKPHTRYRLLSDMTFQQVGADGELKHGELGEMSRQIQADTHGIIFGIDRKMLINDDLGVFLETPGAIGMGWNDAISDAVWTMFLSNAGSFFSAGNKNYLAGADTALSIAGITKAVTQFMKQTKPKTSAKSKSRPLGIRPSLLLTPPELETAAKLFVTSVKLNNGSTTDTPEDNPHAGKYKPVSSPFLSQEGFHANVSGKAWYMLADPKRLPVIEVAFLNGRQKPIVEQSDQAFNVLGKQFRGYGDFGVALQEPKAGLKMKGEA